MPRPLRELSNVSDDKGCFNSIYSKNGECIMQGRYQFSWQAAEGQKRFCLESFSFFFFFLRTMHFHYLHSAHQKDVLSKAVCSLFGVIWWSQGFLRNESNNAFSFCISLCLWEWEMLIFLWCLGSSPLFHDGKKSLS